MIDFHTHILPGIDDGSSDVRESTELLQEEMRQGVKGIIATPHFYANRISVEGFLRQRNESIRLWNEYLSGREEVLLQEDFLGIKEGAEVYFFPGMGRAERLKELCIRGTDTILVEMPFVQWNDDVLRELTDILQKQRLRIVLAHVERYPEFQKSSRVWDEVLSLPLTLQVNGGSFLKGRSRRKFCLDLLKKHSNVIIGSDCHNLTTRRPNLAQARELIGKKLGKDRLAQIDALTMQMIEP